MGLNLGYVVNGESVGSASAAADLLLSGTPYGNNKKKDSTSENGGAVSEAAKQQAENVKAVTDEATEHAKEMANVNEDKGNASALSGTLDWLGVNTANTDKGVSEVERHSLNQQRDDLQKQYDDLKDADIDSYTPDQLRERQIKMTDTSKQIKEISTKLGDGKLYQNGQERTDDFLSSFGKRTVGAYENAVSTLAKYAQQNEEKQRGKGVNDEEHMVWDTDGLTASNLNMQSRSNSFYKALENLGEKGKQNIRESSELMANVTKDLNPTQSFFVNALSTGLDVAADTALSMATFGGAGAVSMAARAFGMTAAESAEKGDDIETQVAKGTTAAAIGVLTEKLGGGFEKAYGATLAKKLGSKVGQATEKAVNANAAAIKTFIKSAGSEGFEEGLEDVLQIVADRLFKWDDGKGTILEKIAEDKDQIFQDMLMGGFVGMFGAAGQSIEARNAAIAQSVDAAINSVANPDTTTHADVEQTAPTVEPTAPQTPADILVEMATGGVSNSQAEQIITNPNLRAAFEETTGIQLEGTKSEQRNTVKTALEQMEQQNTEATVEQPAMPTESDIAQTPPENAPVTPTVPANENIQPTPQNNAQTAPIELNSQAQQTAPAEPINRPLFNTPMGMNGTSEVREGRFSSNTLNNVQEANNIPEADRVSFTYETKPERQSVMEAAARLGNDRANEVQRLIDAEAWSGVQTDMAAQVERELYESGDVKAHADWVKIMNDHAISGGQGVQAWAKYSRKTGQNALEEVINAVNANENLTEEQRTQILNKADEAAHKYDNVQNDILNAQKAAKESGTKAEAPQSLIDFIKETSEARNTGTIFSTNLDKLLNAQKGNLDYLNSLAYNQMIAMSNDYTTSRTLAEKVKSFQILSQLSSIATFARNIGGNVSFGTVDALLAQDGFGVALDYLVSKSTGKRTVSFDKSWASSAARKGAMDGFQKSALEIALDVDMGGTSKYGQSSGRTFKMSGSGVERFFSRWEQLLNYSLSASDRTSRGQMEAETTRSLNALKNSGLTDAEIQAIAEQTADYRLFQNQGNAYKMSKGAHDVLNVLGFGGQMGEGQIGRQGGFGLGDIINTYPGVPANLGVKALEYSPANILKGGIELAKVMKDAKSGKLDAAKQNQAVMDVARGMSGMPMVALFAALFKAGIVKNWDDEDDYDVMSQNATEGKSGTQVNWDAVERWANGEDPTWRDGDTLDNIGWLEPINAFMAIGSLVANEDDDATLASMAGDWAEGAIQGVLEIPVMSNIANAMDNFKYSTADNIGGKLTDAAVSYVGSSATGFVPSPVRGVATSLDDYQRDTKGNTAVKTAINSLKATIPGLRETLPTKRDGYGNERTNDGTPLERAFNTMINPSNRTHLKQSDVSNEVERLRLATDNANIYPERKAPKYLNYGGDNKVQLDVDQQREYFEFESKKTNELYESVMKNKGWDNFTDEQKASLLSEAKSVANAMAKAEYAKSHNIDFDDQYQKLIDGVDDYGTANDIPPLGEKNLIPYLEYHSMYKLAEKSGDDAQFDNMLGSFKSLPKAVQDVFLKKQDGAKNKLTAYNVGVHTTDYNAYSQAKKEAQGLFDKSTDNNGLCELYALGNSNISDKAKKAILENRKELGWLSNATATSYEILSKYGFDYEDVANFFYSADFTITENHPEGKSGGTLGAYETAYALSQIDTLSSDQRGDLFKELKSAFSNTYNNWSPKSYEVALSRVGRYEKEYGSIYGRRADTDTRINQIKGSSKSGADMLYSAVKQNQPDKTYRSPYLNVDYFFGGN